MVFRAYGPRPDRDVRVFLMHGVSVVARLLGCGEISAAKQYTSVVPYMLERMAPGRPLANVSNQEAWATLLRDDVWEVACLSGTLAAFGALRKFIRFYISIEDGECTVERDLGEFRSLRRSHKTSDQRFYCDPRSPSYFS